MLGQNFGEIRGTVLDSATKETIIGANVTTEYGGRLFGAATDLNGDFVLKNLNIGIYVLNISFMGYNSQIISKVQVLAGDITYLKTIRLEVGGNLLGGVTVTETTLNPLMNKAEPTKICLIAAQIKSSPEFRNIGNLVSANCSDVKVSEDGRQMHFRGSREGAEGYYIDGVKANSLSGYPSQAIGNIVIYTGGIPARYGDVVGGVVAIETKSYFDLLNDWKARNPEKE